MADLVLVEFCGTPLAFTREEVERARDRAQPLLFATAAAAPSSADSRPEPLLDADQAAAQLGVTARWLEDSARAGIVPHHKLGRFIRFRVSEVADHCRVEGAPMPSSTDSQSVTPFRRQSRQ